MGLLRRILGACGRAAGRVARGPLSSTSVEVPEKVQKLCRDITQGEFGGVDYNVNGISFAWIKLPKNRIIHARWYSSGKRSELWMRRADEIESTELPDDQWSEMILRHIILKTKLHHEDKLKGLLDV